MKKIIIWIAMVPLVVAGHLFYLYTHREFGPGDFEGHFVGEFATGEPDAEAKAALGQRYTYLGHGKQMTAYESEDGRYVIKFVNPRAVIKEKAFRTLKGMKKLCTMKWISNAYFKRSERLKKLYARYQMAFEDLKEEAGLVYVRLDRSVPMEQKICLADARVELDRCPFVLQRKAVIATKYLKSVEGEKLRDCGRQLYDLFLSRAQKGYTDRIQTLHNNYGFVDGRAIQIDLGRIWRDASVQKAPEKEVERIIGQLPSDLQWVVKR